MGIFKMIEKIIRNLLCLQCRHKSVNQYKKGDFCPDCGMKIKLGWITLRCSMCKSLLLPQIDNFDNIFPLHKFCPDCGSDKWYSCCKNNLETSESLYSIVIKEALDENLNSENSSTNVWIEKENNPNLIKFKTNIIKARKKA